MSGKHTFENSITRLEEVVKLLERGDAPLDDALALFEEGTALIKACSKMLDEAEQKVTLLSKGEVPVEKPFDMEENA